MKKLTFALLAFGTIAFSACKKDNTSTSDDSFASRAAEQADDDARISDEVDAVSMDVTDAVEAAPILAGQRVDQLSPCDATVTYDTLGTDRQVTITYNGVNCQGTRTRTGVVTMTLPLGTHWGDAGAVLTIHIDSLHITRLSDNHSITINGTHTLTNVTGGLVHNLSSSGDIVHTNFSDDMSVTFDNNTQRLWHVARRREFTYDNGIRVSVTGLHSEDGVDGIVEWGINRHGDPFRTAISQPMIHRQDCDFRVTAGQKIHQRLQRVVTATFGLDAQGNPTGCPGQGNPYFLKAEWTDAQGNPHSVLKPY